MSKPKQMLQSGDYARSAQLLMDCCKIDPGNGVFRQALRFAQRRMYGDEGKGQAFAGLRSTFTKLKLQNAERKGNWIEVLRLGELMMMRDPWSVWTNRRVAQALDELGQLDMAIWNLTLIQSANAKDWQLNRQLARLYEKRGSYKEATALWQMVARVRPEEAQRQAKELDPPAGY